MVELDGMADTKALKMAKGPRLYDNKIKMFVNISSLSLACTSGRCLL